MSVEAGTIVAADACAWGTKDGQPVKVTVREIVEGAELAGFARGVAKERARCVKILAGMRSGFSPVPVQDCDFFACHALDNARRYIEDPNVTGDEP